ncbi:MAG: hypothetical protein PHG39_10940 [Acidithiobacillus ferrooxidans]|nr:hypothetical protein [Acidithiobacillus ferrooxidans]MDD5004047.1 hypothetical protein [Acidithiobacillus sp.]MDD5379790.1 hypothetical protein [Acidithiobacillus sp.]MDD5577026.1 hypothetical protein [Acidithiobacillus sp.]
MSDMVNNSGYLTPSGLEGKRSPEYGGRAKIGGRMYWVSGWKNVGGDGREYISIRLKIIPVGPARKPCNSRKQPLVVDDDDDY